MRRGRALLAVLAAAAVGLCALPAAAEDAFARGNRAYAEGRYLDAVARYEEALAGGAPTAVLHTNLGAAYLRAGQLGRAILAYERALRLDPGDDDARYDRDVARELAAARFGKDTVVGAAREPLLARAARHLPGSTVAWSFLALDVLFFGVLLVVRFLPSGLLRTGLVVSNLFVGLAGLVFGLLFAANVVLVERVRASVVVADEVTMREGPDRTRREMPRLHAGHRVVIVGEQAGWVRIRLANRVEGWVPRDTVEEI